MENVSPANPPYNWNNTIVPIQLGPNQNYMSNPHSFQFVSQSTCQQNTEAVHANLAQLSGKN